MPNKVRLCFIAFLCLLVRANCQNIENQLVASQYGAFKVPSVGTGFSFPPASCQVSGGGKNFAAFSTSAAVKIVDTNPAKIEVVTPTAVFINSCAVSLSTTFPHTDFYLTSGTGGLQEAITNGQVHGTPNTVILDQEWYSLIQPRSAATVIASVQGNTSMGIVDVTTTPYTYYQWSGSAYVVVQISGTGLPLTGGVLSGALIAPEINGEVFPASCGSSSPAGWCSGTTADAWIRAACNVFPAGSSDSPSGGFVNLRGLTGNIAATTRGCSTPTRQIIFEYDSTVRLAITETDGDISFPLDNYSAMVGPASGQCIFGSGIAVASGANIAAIVGPAHTDGTQEAFSVTGTCLTGNQGATVTQGPVLVQGVFANTTISNNNIAVCNGYCVKLVNSSSVQMLNNWLNASDGSSFNVSPLLIQATGGGGCRTGTINISGGQIEHAYGGAAEITIQGDGAGAWVCGVQIANVGIERNGTNGAPIGIKVVDGRAVSIDHVTPTGTVGGTDLFNFSQTSSGAAQNDVVTNTEVGGTYTNALTDTVDTPNVILTTASTPQITTAYIAPGYAQAGVPIGPSGGCLTGTYPNPGLLPSCVVAGVAGQPIVPSSVSSKIVNGISNCAAYSGSTVDAQVNACIVDIINKTNGNTTGWGDARGLTGNSVTTAQINAGNVAGNVGHLMLPCSGTWQGSMTDGTSVTLKQFGGFELVGCPVASASGAFYLGATSGSNLYAIYEQAGSAAPYIYASGFNALNSAGHATASHYTAIVDGGTFGAFSDASDVKNVNVNDFSNPSGGGILFRNVCCAYTWENSAFNSNGGGTPITIQADSTSYIQGLNFLNDTVVDPGTGKPAVFCSDSRSPHVSQVLWTGGYTETNTTDTNTAPFQTSSGNPCQQMTFRDYGIYSNVSSNASPIFSGSTSTILTLDNVNLRPGTGTWTYPIAAVSGQPAVTDSVGHIDHWVTQTSPSYFGPTSAASFTGKVISGVSYSVNYPGSTLDARVNAAMVDACALTNGNNTGVVSSLGEPYPVAQTGQLNVGCVSQTAQAVTWQVPGGFLDNVTLTDGTKYAVFQYSKTRIECIGVQEGGCLINNLSAANNIYAMYGTADTADAYYHMNGMWFINGNTGSTMASGHLGIIANGSDGSAWTNNQWFDVPSTDPHNGATLLIHPNPGDYLGFHSEFENNTVDSDWGQTAVDIEITGTNEQVAALDFLNNSFNTHNATATGNPNFVCRDTVGASSVISISGVKYEEGQAANMSAPFNYIDGCRSVSYNGQLTVGPTGGTSGGTTSPIIEVSARYPTSLHVESTIAYSGSNTTSNWALPAVVVKQDGVTADCGTPPCNVAVTDANGNFNGYDTGTFGAENLSTGGKLFLGGAGLITSASTNMIFNNTNTSGEYLFYADSPSHMIALSETGSPFSSTNQWYRGASTDSTGWWLSSDFSANIKVGDQSGTYGLNLVNSNGDTVVQLTSQGQVIPASYRRGTFTCTAGGTISVGNTFEKATSDVIISMHAQAGTVTAAPFMLTVTPGTGFSVKCSAADTSVYNYDIMN